jgi:hypothetical protein
VGTGLRVHEPWADEAQAWLLARDLSWPQLVRTVRYEGTPALWHTVLSALVHLRVSYAAMHAVAALFALGAVVVVLGWAPFPRLLRLLLPFTFFLAYQDAVIARSYVLFALFAFGSAALLRGRRARPWAVALLLGLLANLSVHGLVLAAGLLVIAWRVFRANRVATVGPLALLAAMLALSVASILPPHDIDFPAGRNIEHSWQKTLAQLHGRRLPATDSVVADQPRPGELPEVTLPRSERGRGLRHRLLRVLALVTFPLSTVRVLGLLTAGALLWLGICRARAKGAGPLERLSLLPYALLLLVFQSLYFAPRHAGTLFAALVVTAWLLWPRADERQTPALPLLVCLLLVCAEQVGWTAHALWADVRGAYSPSRMTAGFLRGLPPGTRVAGYYYHSISALPFFASNVFENQPRHGYWLWSTANRIDQAAPAELARRPDVVVLSGWQGGPSQSVSTDWESSREDEDAAARSVPFADLYGLRPYFLAHGYRETHRFCGHSWIRFDYSEESCDFVLERGREPSGEPGRERAPLRP